MNLEYFQSFLEAVNQRSLSKASERLNISQPALSKQIRKVEEYFNIQLLSRTTTGVELTEAGKVVFSRLPGILKEISSLQSEVNQLQNVFSYRIGTLPSLAGHYIPSKILKLKEKGHVPEVVVKNTSQEVFELLTKGEVDAAIIEEMSGQKSYWQKELFVEPFCLVVHMSNKLSKKNSVLVEELSNEEFVLYPSNCKIRQSISQRIQNLTIKSEVEFGEFLIGYVAAGGGVTVVPELTARNSGNPMVKAIPIRDSEMVRRISLITQSKETGKHLYPFFKQ